MRFYLKSLIALMGAVVFAAGVAWHSGDPGQAATPVATSPTPATPTIGSGAQPLSPAPTSTPIPPEQAGEHLARARELAATAIGPQQIIAQVISGTVAFLSQNGPEDNRLSDLLHFYPEGPAPRLEPVDLDGDGEKDLLVFLNAGGGRGLAFLHAGDGYRGFDLTPALHPFLFTAQTPHLERVADINGDDRPEIISTYGLPAVDCKTNVLSVQTWDGGKFSTLFARLVSGWGGAAGWQFVSHSEVEDVVIHYPLIGVFDSRHLPHQTITETWRWDGEAYELANRQVSPPETRHQQVNQAESLFRSGDYEQAVAAYQQVSAANLRDYRQGSPAPEPNWIGFAQFRLAQCHALLGDRAAAEEALTVARRSSAPLSQLAWNFSQAYGKKDDADALPKAFGALYNLRLDWLIYLVNPGNIVFPMESFPVLYPGIGVAAYLDAQADSLATGSGSLDSLASYGLPLRSSYVADLDGDGRVEAVFVTEDGTTWHTWLAYRRAGEKRWRVVVAHQAPSLRLDGIRQQAGAPDRQAVVVYREANAVPPYVLISWDGQNPLCLAPCFRLTKTCEQSECASGPEKPPPF